MKAEIAAELQIRAEFDTVYQELVLRPSQGIFMITTNWDRTVELAAGRVRVIEPLYLHGLLE